MSIKLAPSDAPENIIIVSRPVADMSVTIRNMLEGDFPPLILPLPPATNFFSP
jgi:hypothetical protein